MDEKSYSLRIQEAIGVDLDYDSVMGILSVLCDLYREGYDEGYADAIAGAFYEGRPNNE